MNESFLMRMTLLITCTSSVIGTAIVPGTYEYHLARRYTFSSWLASNASHASDVDTATGISLVWAHLRAHRVAEAVTEAQKNGDYRLALIISQVGKGCVRRVEFGGPPYSVGVSVRFGLM